MNKATEFKKWMAKVDAIIMAKIGVTSADMPDLVFIRDTYDDGATPEEGAEELLSVWVDEGEIPADLFD